MPIDQSLIPTLQGGTDYSGGPGPDRNYRPNAPFAIGQPPRSTEKVNHKTRAPCKFMLS